MAPLASARTTHSPASEPSETVPCRNHRSSTGRTRAGDAELTRATTTNTFSVTVRERPYGAKDFAIITLVSVYPSLV